MQKNTENVSENVIWESELTVFFSLINPRILNAKLSFFTKPYLSSLSPSLLRKSPYWPVVVFADKSQKQKWSKKDREDSEIGKGSSRNSIAKPKLSSIHFVCQMRKKVREEKSRKKERKKERSKERKKEAKKNTHKQTNKEIKESANVSYFECKVRGTLLENVVHLKCFHAYSSGS